MSGEFGQRLTLALKALSMSRGRLAAELEIDKSVVGRWAAGAVRPSAHNLERLTHFLAVQRPGLTLLDWDRDIPDFARLFGVDMTGLGATGPSVVNLSAQLLDSVRNSVDARVEAYEGFWRATHPAVFEPGRFCHQYGIIRREAGDVLRFELGAHDVRYAGSMFPVEGQVFAIAFDSVRHLPSFMILNAVTEPRIALLDGLLIAAGNALRTPAAYCIILERIGDLSGDREADDLHAAGLMDRPEFAEDPERIPAVVRSHLLRDFGPTAAALGGEMMLTAPLTARLAQIISTMSR